MVSYKKFIGIAILLIGGGLLLFASLVSQGSFFSPIKHLFISEESTPVKPVPPPLGVPQEVTAHQQTTTSSPMEEVKPADNAVSSVTPSTPCASLPHVPPLVENKEEVLEDTLPQENSPSIDVPPLVEPPAVQGLDVTSTQKGQKVRLTVNEVPVDSSPSVGILGTTSSSGGRVIPSSEDVVIPFIVVQDIARDMVNGYWPKGFHMLASTSGVVTTGFSFVNTRYGSRLVAQFGAPHASVEARGSLIAYLLAPSMVDGLYTLYSERFIRLVNRHAQERVYMRNGSTHTLTNAEIAEMYGLYAQVARNNSGCIKAYSQSQEIQYITGKFLRAEEKLTKAYMEYQERVVASENQGIPLSRQADKDYRLKVVEHEVARQNVIASFRRFTDTRNMDTSDLVFLAKWLNRRSTTHQQGLIALATALEKLALRMEQEQHVFLTHSY